MADEILCLRTRVAVDVRWSMFIQNGYGCHRVSLLGAKRRSNPVPDERSSAPQTGDCFVASLLAMTAASTIPVTMEMLWWVDCHSWPTIDKARAR